MKASAEREKKNKEIEERRKAKNARIETLNNERNSLLSKKANLKGLFAGQQRKSIEARIAEIDEELNQLK